MPSETSALEYLQIIIDASPGGPKDVERLGEDVVVEEP